MYKTIKLALTIVAAVVALAGIAAATYFIVKKFMACDCENDEFDCFDCDAESCEGCELFDEDVEEVSEEAIVEEAEEAIVEDAKEAEDAE